MTSGRRDQLICVAQHRVRKIRNEDDFCEHHYLITVMEPRHRTKHGGVNMSKTKNKIGKYFVIIIYGRV